MPATRSEQAWLDVARTQVLRGDPTSAQAILKQALAEWPASVDLRRTQAGVYLQAGLSTQAESVLKELLARNSHDVATTFALANLLKAQGRTAAVAAAVRACFEATSNLKDANLAIAATELLDDCDRKRDAAALAEAAIAQNPDDPRLHAYAGMLVVQLGEFERARQHYAYALEHDARAWEWHVPLGLASAQRYDSREHPDFTRFREGLLRHELSELARAELHFALGKAHDDVGDWIDAARHFRNGNAIRHRLTHWPRKTWRRETQARLAGTPFLNSASPTEGFTPILVVGMPRSGTTLLAELLSRLPTVCNRGELPWLARLAQQTGLDNTATPEALDHMAAQYARQARRDDPGGARWFIDKQPLNFRYVDLALALFPDAKIIHCRRNRRDTALSLWMQCFLEDVQGYAYDFDDIELVMHDCGRLMAHWEKRFPAAIRSVDYEQVAAEPDKAIAELAAWIGLPGVHGAPPPIPIPASPISTASLWQARQPVHTRSVNRAESYLTCIPELARWASP